MHISFDLSLPTKRVGGADVDDEKQEQEKEGGKQKQFHYLGGNDNITG